MSKIPIEDFLYVYKLDYPERRVIIARYHVLCY